MMLKKNADFWQQIGFVVLDRQEMDGTLIIEVAQSKDAGTAFVLYDREFIEQHSPGTASGAPSLMFNSEDILVYTKRCNN